MNSITVIGRLGRDPSSKVVNGMKVCAFSIAVDGRKAADGKKETLWLEVRAWEKLGDNCQKYLVKGRQVAIIGELKVEEWTGRDGHKRTSVGVIANSVEFLSDGAKATATPPAPGGYQADDSDIPF
jgi:single-strand DNA-binding protein